MSHIPYFSFYPSDFMNGIRGLSAQEVGVYTMLLCRIYEENGPIENHALRLATYCGMRVPTFEKVLSQLIELGKIIVVDGGLFNDRAASEIAKRSDGLKNNSKAGKASAKKRQQKQAEASTPVQQPLNHTDTDTDTDKNTEPYGSGESVADPAKAVWKFGVEALAAHGLHPDKARTMIGKWRKDHPGKDADILTAIIDCGREGIVDPVPWIQARLSPKPAIRYHDFSKYMGTAQ